MVNNKHKNDLNNEEFSLQEFRKQIINQNKGSFINTLNQNFESPRDSDNIDNNIYKKNIKIEAHINPSANNDRNIIDNKIQNIINDKPVGRSDFNLLDLRKINDKAINNVNQISNNNEISNDVNYIVNNISNVNKNQIESNRIENEKEKGEEKDQESNYEDYVEEIV